MGMIMKIKGKNNFFASQVFFWNIKKELKLFRNIEIQYRILILMLAISLIPLIVTSIFSYKSSTKAIRSKISIYSVQVMDQISENIEREIDRLENDSVEIEFSDLVQKTLLNYDKMTSWEILDRQFQMKEMLVKKFSFLHDVSDVLIYTNKMDKLHAYGDKGFPLNFTNEYLNRYLGDIQKEKGRPVWTSLNLEDQNHLVSFATTEEQLRKSNGILVGRSVKSLINGDIIGSLIIRINERYFEKIYRDIDLGKGANIFVTDKKGMMISSRNNDIPVGKPYKNGLLIKSIIENFESGNQTFTFEINDHMHLIAFTPIEKTDWFVVSTIPFSYLNSESAAAGINSLLLALVCSILAIVFSYLFSKSISLPLKKLVFSMKLAKLGNLSVNIKDDSKDEIGEVTRNFNENG